MAPPWSRKRLLPVDPVLSFLLIASIGTVKVFATAISPLVYDGLLNVAPTTCPVAQDGYSFNTFPWTHDPTCVDVNLGAHDSKGRITHHTFCAYTNANYNNGRGISFVVSPEVAASISYETFDMAVGGLDGSIGENMGIWEVRDTERKGKGLFARRDIAGIFAGESFIVETPALFVSRQLLEMPSTLRHELVLSRAIEQLPERTKLQVQALAKTRDRPEAVDIVMTNGIPVKWPWVDEVPELLVVMPEAGVSATSRDVDEHYLTL
jgi:hypothetical protein